MLCGCQLRADSWFDLSPRQRIQFGNPPPKMPRSPDIFFPTSVDAGEGPLETYGLVTLDPQTVCFSHLVFPWVYRSLQVREVTCIEGGASGISVASSVCYVWSFVPESWGMVLEVAKKAGLLHRCIFFMLSSNFAD